MKFDLLWNGAFFVVGILRPFLVGGMIAFVINLPMKFYETRLFKNGNLQGKAGKALNRCSRGLSLLLAILSVVLAITLLAVTVIPQLASTIKDLANKIPAFWNDVIMKGLGLADIYIGVMGFLEGGNTMILIVAIVFGAMIGEGLKIER